MTSEPDLDPCVRAAALQLALDIARAESRGLRRELQLAYASCCEERARALRAEVGADLALEQMGALLRRAEEAESAVLLWQAAVRPGVSA